MEEAESGSGQTSVLWLPQGVEKSAEEVEAILDIQNRRKVSTFEAAKLEVNAKRNWDIFYKRNETRFFKDRHWTLREFQEILDWNKKGKGPCEDESAWIASTRVHDNQVVEAVEQTRSCESEEEGGRTKSGNSSFEEGPTLLEVGCGCGNFAIPLLQEVSNLKVLACDFSPRAVNFVKSHPNYDENRIRAFVCDITEENCFRILKDPIFQFEALSISENSCKIKKDTKDCKDEEPCEITNTLDLNPSKVDFLSMIFVLSAISPSKHSKVVENIASAVQPGGIVFFRDYGLYDMAQLRFKGGNKIDENFYVRRDGTRAYYFIPEEVERLFTQQGQFQSLQCEFVHRRTVNVKEDVDVSRIFVQGKFIKL